MPGGHEFCQHHEERMREAAMHSARIDNLETWMSDLSKKVDEHHEKEMDAINKICQEIHHGRGAVWMLIKIGGLVGGLIAFATLLYKLFVEKG